MSNIGFDEAGLSRLHDLMAGYVENGTVPGIVRHAPEPQR